MSRKKYLAPFKSVINCCVLQYIKISVASAQTFTLETKSYADFIILYLSIQGYVKVDNFCYVAVVVKTRQRNAHIATAQLTITPQPAVGLVGHHHQVVHPAQHQLSSVPSRVALEVW